MRDVYEAVEGPILLCRCRQRVEPCGDDACDTHEFWSGVETLLTQELQTVTFAALADQGRRPQGADGRPQRGEEVKRMAELKEQVEKALGDIRPALQADGGDIELVDVWSTASSRCASRAPAPAARCRS